MSPDRFITFAYGSNMLTARLQERCKSAKLIGVGELKGHELRWHKRSIDRSGNCSGKCDILPSNDPAAVVLGVLYEISPDEESTLDEAEGLGKGYVKIAVQARCNGTDIAAKAYQATAVDESLRPYTWYRALVVAGAKEQGLPANYVAGLEAAPAIEDPDHARHDKHMRLIGEVQV